MKEIQQLTSREIDVINRLMENKAVIVLEPTEEGYMISERHQEVIYCEEDTATHITGD
ncbi:MAG: hypothetical protein ACI4I1_10370 [Oscillospiraceae bacterium]